MDLKLQSKTVFISGSTKGIGYATAKTLAKEGARVIINGRTIESVDKALEKLNKEGEDLTITGVPCDFSKPKEIQHLIEQIGAVDILINNVGIFENKDFLELSDADWNEIYQVNVMSGVRLSRALLPSMLEKDWGRIIFISSESALNIPEEMIHYGMTKTAMLAVSRGIAETVKGTNVTVNSILPGPTRTTGLENNLPEGQDFDDFAQEFFKKARPTSLLQRFADPQEVANMIAYVASPLSSASNGASLRVDGGVVKTI